METIRIKGQDVRVGDELWTMGSPDRITRIEPYVHPVITRNEEWRTARRDWPDGTKAFGRTLAYEHGRSASYTITYVDGDPRKTVTVPADDYLDPFAPAARDLWARYQAEGMPGLWRDWVAKLPPEALPGPRPSGLACFTGVTPDPAALSPAGPDVPGPRAAGPGPRGTALPGGHRIRPGGTAGPRR